MANLVFRWLVSSVYAGLAILGSQLHQIAGIHHGHCVSNFYCAGSSEDLIFQSGSVAQLGAASRVEGCHDPAHCPICHYLGQAKLLGDRVDTLWDAVVLATFIPSTPLFAPGDLVRQFQARAPPVA